MPRIVRELRSRSKLFRNRAPSQLLGEIPNFREDPESPEGVHQRHSFGAFGEA